MMRSLKLQELNFSKIDQKPCCSKDLQGQEKQRVPKSLPSKSIFLWSICPSRQLWASTTDKVRKDLPNSGKTASNWVKSSSSSTKSMRLPAAETQTCMRQVEEFYLHFWGKLTVLSQQQMCCWFVLLTENKTLMLQCCQGLILALSLPCLTNIRGLQFLRGTPNTWKMKT